MRKPRTVKMKDVAERAGVSAMTVSLALRGDASDSRMSEETRRRVRQAARELRYLPNARGRALRSGFTNVIGLYAGYGWVNVRLSFFTEIVSGLQDGCEQFKKDLLLHGTFHGQTPDDIYAELADGRIDGLVVNMPPDDPLAERLADSHFPVVAVADPLPKVPSIVADDAAGSRMLADYLASRGHRRFLYLISDLKPLSAVRRRDTFVERAAELALEVEEIHLPSRTTLADHLRQPLFSRVPQQRPTAVVCWSDTTAYDVLAYCRQHSVRVPDDVAIAGFNGCPTPIDRFWSLTTIRAPWAAVARLAVRYLDSLLDGKSVPEETVLPVELVHGHTA
jgi:LacI family transcriptional regulator, galactose operon repressor